MAMSRTARILIAILLLAAAAFFWVNFYTQSRTAELPTPTDVVTADADAEPATPQADAASVAADADADAAAVDGTVTDDAEVPADADGAAAADAVASAPAEGDADGEPSAEAPLVVAPAADGPPTVVVDAPVVGREIVIADLPFLVTEPRPTDAATPVADAVEGEITRGVTTPTRATINPFSPVVVRTPPAPERIVPDTASVVGEVAVPAGPTPAEIAAAEVAARASAPTPRAITPGSPGGTSALRPLPSGSVLSSTPALLRETRVGTVAEEVDFATVTTIAVPVAEPATLAPAATAPAQADAPDEIEPLASASAQPDAAQPEVAQPEAAQPEAAQPDADQPEVAQADADQPEAAQADADQPDAAQPDADQAEAAQVDAGETPSTVAADPPPLAAGATQLARFLRDQNYTFTGSVLGPVGIGVFRSNLDADPVVVALGQTLPDTEIVLTDLRGQQAELRLGDSTQILTLDLRR